jgi:hypothetical protein
MHQHCNVAAGELFNFDEGNYPNPNCGCFVGEHSSRWIWWFEVAEACTRA